MRDTPLRELWHSSPARRQAADIAVAANDALLARGGAEARFPFCPALAQQRTGDPLKPDAAFRLAAEAAQKARALEATA